MCPEPLFYIVCNVTEPQIEALSLNEDGAVSPCRLFRVNGIKLAICNRN